MGMGMGMGGMGMRMGGMGMSMGGMGMPAAVKPAEPAILQPTMVNPAKSKGQILDLFN